jgi:hypothetical protein
MSDQESARSGRFDADRAGGMDASKDSSSRFCRGFKGNGWWHDRSLPVKILMGVGFGILGLGLMALFGWVVMSLWNWLMPDLFGLKRIGYWQAWGLLVLCKILFHGRGSGSSGMRSDRKRRRYLRRYMQENPPPADEAMADS